MFDLTSFLSQTTLEREDIPAQVTVAECTVLKYLASGLTGAGAIGDLGADAGSSTRAMAEGAAVAEIECCNCALALDAEGTSNG